jgi:hypothetical protein
MPRKTTKADADAKPKRRVSAKAKPKPKPPVSRVSRVRATGRGGRGR